MEVKTIKRKNKIKPTQKQRKAFENIEAGMSKRQAMLKAGYSERSSLKAKQNLTEREGYKELLKKYRDHLRIAGVNEEVLAEVQAEGLFDQDARVRLEYLKETKKDFELVKDKDTETGNTTNILIMPSEVITKNTIQATELSE